MKKFLYKVSPWFWALSAGVIGLYLFGLLMGAFSPGQLWAWTALVIVLGVLSVRHSITVRRALREGDPELRRAEGRARESRGF